MYSDQQIVEFVKANYDLLVESKPLPGELDNNFFLTEKLGSRYVLKVANKQEKQVNLELQNAIIDHLNSKKTGLQVSRLIRSIHGEDILRINSQGNETRMVRLLTWVEGRVFAKTNPHSP